MLFIIPLLGLSCGHLWLTLHQRCGNGGQISIFWACQNFVTASIQSVSCFSLKPLCFTLSWPPCAFQPSLTSPLDWVEATLDSLCTEMWQTAEQQCPHFSWSSHKKPTHTFCVCVRFCDYLLTQCLSWNWSKVLLHHLCPFKTVYIPLYYGWASCTIKLKENSLWMIF